jgi:hypothetical protein
MRGVLLPVPLDGVGVACCGLIRIYAGVPEGASLAQQVPADVELDLNGTQAPRVCLERLGFILLLSVSQRVLLFNKALDSRSDALIAHDPNATPSCTAIDANLATGLAGASRREWIVRPSP